MTLTALKPDAKLPLGLSPAETRRARQREEARRAILDAAEALLDEAGGEAFGVRALAARCGYTAPTIYHYFGDKDGVIDALLEERFVQLLAEVRRVPVGGDPVAILRGMVRAYMRFGERNPAFYRLLLAMRRDGADRSPPSVEEAVAIMMQPWEDLRAAGRLDVTPEAAAQAIWGLLHGLTALRLARPEHAWAPRLAEIGVDAILRGLVRDPETPKRRARRTRGRA